MVVVFYRQPANSRNMTDHNKTLLRNGEVGSTTHQHPNSPRQASGYSTNQLDKNHVYLFTKSASLLVLTHGLGSFPHSHSSSLSHPIYNIYILNQNIFKIRSVKLKIVETSVEAEIVHSSMA